MTASRTEAQAIARLYGRDPLEIIGWVYVWNTGELAILWLERKRPVHVIDPPLDPDSFCRDILSNGDVLAQIAPTGARSLRDL